MARHPSPNSCLGIRLCCPLPQGERAQQQSSLFLRAAQRDVALGAEHVGVEVGDPLPAVGSDVQIADRGLHVGSDAVPVELWVLVDEIGRRLVAELAVEAGLLEFVVERVGLADVVRIAELPDQIGGRIRPASSSMCSTSAGILEAMRVPSTARDAGGVEHIAASIRSMEELPKT